MPVLEALEGRGARLDRHGQGRGGAARARARGRARQRRDRAARRSGAGRRGGGLGRLPLSHAHAGGAAHDAGRPALRRRCRRREGVPGGTAARRDRCRGSRSRSCVWIPASVSAKRVEHNLELVRRLGELAALGPPVVIGFSRKSSLGKILGDPHATTGPLAASLAVAVAAYERGAAIIRAHDVREHVEALAAARAVLA